MWLYSTDWFSPAWEFHVNFMRTNRVLRKKHRVLYLEYE